MAAITDSDLDKQAATITLLPMKGISMSLCTFHLATVATRAEDSMIPIC